MNIALYTLRAIAELLTDPYSLFTIFILGVLLYRKNKKTTVMQRMITGEYSDSPLELTLSQIVMGIASGVLVSMLLSYAGVMFDQNSLVYLIFFISFILMFINSKFICFSYSAAVLGLASLMLSSISKAYSMPGLDPFKIDVVSLMSAVAILHFVEAIMVMADGGRGSIPVFSERNGKIVGGFSLQRYWVIPITLFFLISDKSFLSGSVSSPLPNWWPIVKPLIPQNVLKNATVTLAAFIGVIGYNSVTFTQSKREKLNASALYILLYSLALFALAQAARYSVYLQVLVLFFAPFGHEVMLRLGKRKEAVKEPKYVSTDDGIMVLQVNRDSVAEKMGIKSGDIITEINGESLKGSHEVILQNMVTGTTGPLNDIKIKILRNNRISELTGRFMGEERRLGLVYVPRTIPNNSKVVKVEENKFNEILQKIKEKSNSFHEDEHKDHKDDK